MTWWESLVVNTALSIFRQALHKPGQAEKLKHIALDIFLAIKAGYPDDPDFK